MSKEDESTLYFQTLINLLTEAELQLRAHGSHVHALRYRELLVELRSGLNAAIVASRYILAEMAPTDPLSNADLLAECVPGVH